ncbi:bifunctional adenosylcobinamide kinase/adenosylcobinamide-phosphate guanylyltransferase [Neobacillus sp. K501]
METTSTLIFITGGVRSGKSNYAEQMAVEIARKYDGQLTYIATGVPSDQEMKQRIAKHQQDREAGLFNWKTIERSLKIGEIADGFCKRDIILLDCVTTLLNNELFSNDQDWDEAFIKMTLERIVNGILAIKSRAGTLIVVSNEVFYEPNVGNELVFTYRKLLGQIHQRLVENADQAILVEAGIPIMMKGAGR